MRKEQPASVLYVYCVTAASKKPLAVPGVGVNGQAAVEPVQVDDLVCWVSSVDAVEFGSELQQNMERLEWLAEASVRHQQVVGAVAKQTDVLPARFGTVFNSSESLVSDMKRRKRSITAALKRVAGADEWGVKVFAEPEPAGKPTVAKSGRDYLQRKAEMLQSRSEKRPDADITELQSALSKVAVEMAPLGKLSGGQRNLQWQASFLVRRSNQAKFNLVLRQFAKRQQAKTVECTGPWPPYSFVSRDGR